MKWSEAYEHSGRTIAVPVKLIHAIGAKGAIMVAQLFHWKDKGHLEDGWIHKTKKEMTDETGISLKEQRKCVEDLTKNGILETRYDRLEHRLCYRINLESLDAIMETDLPSHVPKGHMPKGQVPEAQRAGATSRKGSSSYKAEKTTKKTTKTEPIAVASSVSPEEKKFRDWMAELANEFGLSQSQIRTVESYVPVPGEPYIEEKAALTRSEERENAGGFFMKALRDDYKPRKRIGKQKPEKPATEIQGELLMASDLTEEERAANIAKLREAKKAAKES